MNAGRFPPSGGGSRTITYEDPVGLRQRKLFDAEASAYPHVYDNWRADVVRRCLPRDYDEERRLLYVGITRAESHVVFTAGEDPNQFLQELPVDVTPVDPDIEPYDDGDDGASPFEVTIADPTGPRSLTPHDLMDDSLFEDVEEGEGTAFGTQVHEFAEAYALGADVEPSNDDERNVVAFLDSLSGELQTEVEARLPLTVDGDQVIISGVVDLVHVTPHGVDIVDFKTDRGDHAQAEYRKQLSVYAHVVAAAYPDRDVTASILYTETGVAVEIDVLERSDLRRLARELVSVA